MKVTGLSFNKYLYALLKEDSELSELVGNNIFPIVAEESVSYPFIIFTRNSLSTEYTKTNVVKDSITFSIAIASKNYSETATIAERIRKILELHRDDYFGRIYLTGVVENFIEDAYIQTLTFETNIIF